MRSFVFFCHEILASGVAYVTRMLPDFAGSKTILLNKRAALLYSRVDLAIVAKDFELNGLIENSSTVYILFLLMMVSSSDQLNGRKEVRSSTFTGGILPPLPATCAAKNRCSLDQKASPKNDTKKS